MPVDRSVVFHVPAVKLHLPPIVAGRALLAVIIAERFSDHRSADCVLTAAPAGFAGIGMDVNEIPLGGRRKVQVARAAGIDLVPALRDPFAACVLKIYDGGIQILRVGVFQADVDGFRRS